MPLLGRLDIPSCAPSDAHVSKDVQISRDALVALYNATDGPNWENNGNWLSDKFIGEWYGVVTDEQGRVIKLALGENKMKGNISQLELGTLTNLTELDLQGNWLRGEIPPEIGEPVEPDNSGSLGQPTVGRDTA